MYKYLHLQSINFAPKDFQKLMTFHVFLYRWSYETDFINNMNTMFKTFTINFIQ